MNRERAIGLSLIVLAITLYVIAAVFLLSVKYRCFHNERYIHVERGIKGEYCRIFLKGDKVTFSIRSLQPIRVFITFNRDGERLLVFNSSVVLRYVIPINITNEGKYCLIIIPIRNSTDVYLGETICRYVTIEQGNSITSVIATLSLLLGIIVFVKSFMKTKEITQEGNVSGGTCRTLSLNKHRCILTINDPHIIHKIKDILIHDLKYKLIGNIGESIYIFKKGGKIFPKEFKDKTRTLIVSIQGILTENVLVLDYEISGWVSRGVDDLAGVINEVNYIISKFEHI